MTLKTAAAAFIVLALTACAPSRPSKPFVSVMSATRSKPVAPATTGATPAAALAPGANGEKLAFNNALIAAGYKATPLNGAVYYCRTEAVTNTAFKRRVCLSETEID